MSATPFRWTCLALCTAAVAGLTGCGSFDNMTRGFAGRLTPYKVEVVQGNFVSSEQAAALRPGMSRLQVRELLGSPLLTSVFHANRWDYVFTLKRQGVEPQLRKLSVYFNGDQLLRFEGDAMPSESEFVAQLDGRRKVGKVPPLEASEEALKAFDKGAAAPAAPETPALPPLPASYPPLEAPAR